MNGKLSILVEWTMPIGKSRALLKENLVPGEGLLVSARVLGKFRDEERGQLDRGRQGSNRAGKSRKVPMVKEECSHEACYGGDIDNVPRAISAPNADGLNGVLEKIDKIEQSVMDLLISGLSSLSLGEHNPASERRVDETLVPDSSIAMTEDEATYDRALVPSQFSEHIDSGKGTSDSDNDEYCDLKTPRAGAVQEPFSDRDHNSYHEVISGDDSEAAGRDVGYYKCNMLAQDNHSSQSTTNETGIKTSSLSFVSEDAMSPGVNMMPTPVATIVGVRQMLPSTKLAIVFGASTITLGIAVGSVTLVCAKVPESLPAFLATNQVALLVAACSVVGALILATLIAGVGSVVGKDKINPVLSDTSTKPCLLDSSQNAQTI